MKTSKNQGFTLVEIMATIASATILALTVALILFMGWLSWSATNEQVQLQSDAALAVRMMAHQIRMSETGNVSVITGISLTCDTNSVRDYTITFTKTSDQLRRYISGNYQGLVITKGLTQFTPQIQTNGVLLQMVLISTNSYIPVAITNRTFINTRNRS
jgi:type II secretory pathway pseudopilin PulG